MIKIKQLLAIALCVLMADVAIAQQAATTAPLPPALQAAVNSGNADAITQAIQVLSGGNPSRMAALAQQVAATAERLVSTNPQAAIAAVAAAVRISELPAVMNANAASASSVAMIASRILVSPAIQQIAPQQVASLAVAVSQIVTNPAVYQADPQAAVGVMANAYSAVTSPVVAAAAPASANTVGTILNQAAANPAFSSSIAQIREITQGTTQTTNTPSTEQNTPPVLVEESPDLTQVSPT
jgi:hypothetical protein